MRCECVHVGDECVGVHVGVADYCGRVCARVHASVCCVHAVI